MDTGILFIAFFAIVVLTLGVLQFFLCSGAFQVENYTNDTRNKVDELNASDIYLQDQVETISTKVILTTQTPGLTSFAGDVNVPTGEVYIGTVGIIQSIQNIQNYLNYGEIITGPLILDNLQVSGTANLQSAYVSSAPGTYSGTFTSNTGVGYCSTECGFAITFTDNITMVYPMICTMNFLYTWYQGISVLNYWICNPGYKFVIYTDTYFGGQPDTFDNTYGTIPVRYIPSITASSAKSLKIYFNNVLFAPFAKFNT